MPLKTSRATALGRAIAPSHLRRCQVGNAARFGNDTAGRATAKSAPDRVAIWKPAIPREARARASLGKLIRILSITLAGKIGDNGADTGGGLVLLKCPIEQIDNPISQSDCPSCSNEESQD